MAPGCYSTAGANLSCRSNTTLLVADHQHGQTVTVSPLIRSEDLIDAQGVADALGLSQRTAVSVYQHRYPDMPRPVVNRGNGRILLWLRPEVHEWAKKTGRTK